MIKNLGAFLIVLMSITQIYGQDKKCDCYGPAPNRLVVDQVDILTDNEENILENKLRTLNAETSNEVIIVTLDELCAGDAAMTATEIGHCWGVGQKEFDNGAVILVKPTGGQGQRRTFIATGYGLEGAIPDATAKLIVDNEMIPQFKNGNYFAGLDQAVTRISDLASGEYSYADYNKKVEKKGAGLLGLLPILFFIGIWFLLTYRRTSSYARNNDLGFWAALMLMNASRRSHSGSWNSFSSGSGSFGGSGGFGGFGGGGFGGGGAGGSW